MDLDTPPTFRRAWRGYHPEDVDRFLKETAEERQRLRDALARVETLIAVCQDGPAQIVAAAQREAEEIKATAKTQARQFLEEVKRRLPEVSHRNLLSSPAASPFAEAPLPVVSDVSLPLASPQPVRSIGASASTRIEHWDVKYLHPEPVRRGKRTYRIFGIAAACVVILVVQVVDFQGARALLRMNTESLGAAPMASQAAEAGAVVRPVDANGATSGHTLTLTLSALKPCWVRTVIDGKHEMERMLQTNETLVLHAHDEALLKVGDAAALALLINNRPARPLGESGQVVTQLITRANYPQLLTE